MSDKKTQLDRFKEAAREIGADDDEERFNKRLRAVVQQPKAHASDCSLHNAPAYVAGDCDCGAS